MLTQSEADKLLKTLKRSFKKFISIPKKGTNMNFNVESNIPKEKFTINLFQGNIANKQNISARITKNNIMLLELHINATNKHFNPKELGGELILGSHWHIYKEGFDTKFAYPATDILSDDFIDNSLLFFKKFNIIGIEDMFTQQILDI